MGARDCKLTSLLTSGLVRVNRHVERAGVVLDLGGSSTGSGEREDGGLGEHCDCVEECD